MVLNSGPDVNNEGLRLSVISMWRGEVRSVFVVCGENKICCTGNCLKCVAL